MPLLFRCLAILLLVGLPSSLVVSSATAQVNIERIRQVVDEGFSGRLGGDLDFLSGNAERFEISTTSRLDYKRGPHLTFLVASLRYGERNDQRYKNSAFAHLRTTYRATSLLQLEAFSQVERDGFTLLQIRLLLGGGVRLGYLTSDRFQLYQGVTLMGEHEQLQRNRVERHPATITTVRLSNYLNVQLKLSDTASLSTTTYLQPRLDAVGDLRLLHDTVLSVSLTERVILTTTLNIRYDSRPPDGIGSTDLALRNGLALIL